METEIGELKNQIKTMANAKGSFQSYARKTALLLTNQKVAFKHPLENWYKSSSSEDQAKKDQALETQISKLTGELSDLRKNSHMELIQEKKKIDELRSRIERGLTTISDLERKLVEKNDVINNFKKG